MMTKWRKAGWYHQDLHSENMIIDTLPGGILKATAIDFPDVKHQVDPKTDDERLDELFEEAERAASK